VLAAQPATARGSAVQLGGDPKGKTFLYCNGRSVIIRDIENPSIADQYTEHISTVNVARYSPSGFYIASGGMRRLTGLTGAKNTTGPDRLPAVPAPLAASGRWQMSTAMCGSGTPPRRSTCSRLR